MDPEKVLPKNFKVDKVIYTSNDKFFSICIGEGDGGNEYATTSKRFAMRWNGHTDEEKGFPTSNGHPMWFQLPNDLGDIFKAIMDNYHELDK